MSPKIPSSVIEDRTTAPLEALASVAAALDEPGGRATFVRGLTIGALAGAALVGAVLQLRRTTRTATRR